MVMVTTNISGHMQKQLSRSLERILEEAHLSGELKLSGRKLKEFPKIYKNSNSLKYDLQDTVLADLSKNRFTEFPEEITEFVFLEKLHLYHNAIRVIPENVAKLQSLSYLDVSRNQLTILPREICRLPLQTLLVAYNRLVTLPEELGRMSVLAELDAGCNEITSLPSRIGDLPQIKSLDLRSNLLVQIPIELTYLKLVKLDISSNRISVLPNELRKMKSLVEFKLQDNPLTSPPAALCIRGRTHIFKYLERQAAKHERARGCRARRGPFETRGHATLDLRSHRRHNVDVECSDGHDKRWSQEINSGITILQEKLGKNETEETIVRKDEESQKLFSTNHQTSSTLLEYVETVEVEKTQEHNVVQPIQVIDSLTLVNADENKSLSHIQTYREYKEALKQQRANEGMRVYRLKEQITLPSSSFTSDEVTLPNTNLLSDKQLFCEETNYKRPVQKVTPSRVNFNVALSDGSNRQSIDKNEKYSDQIYKKPNSPIKMTSDTFRRIENTEYTQTYVKTAVNYSEGKKNPTDNSSSPNSARSITWNPNISENYSFTMRREFERAKEEADLVDQLRNHIETRLKMTLPEDLAPALSDGVVLCHLANHVKPRSVASVHVPSPGVPKLTMARCRRNVDNFLDACRKIGVDEEVLLDAEAIMDVGYMDAYGLIALSQLVSVLILYTEEDFQESDIRSPHINQDRVLTTALSIIFISILIFLYAFPIPN